MTRWSFWIRCMLAVASLGMLVAVLILNAMGISFAIHSTSYLSVAYLGWPLIAFRANDSYCLGGNTNFVSVYPLPKSNEIYSYPLALDADLIIVLLLSTCWLWRSAFPIKPKNGDAHRLAEGIEP